MTREMRKIGLPGADNFMNSGGLISGKKISRNPDFRCKPNLGFHPKFSEIFATNLPMRNLAAFCLSS